MNKHFLQKIFFLCLAGLVLSLDTLSVDPVTASWIDREIEKHLPEIISIRRFIHMNPELSNREFETAKLVSSKLFSLGLEVKTGVARTGVVGLLRGTRDGVTVAIRADMDALPIQELVDIPFKSLNPGVMHACGHDIHTSMALGTAYVLASLKEKIQGNIKFIFQPAEEGPPPGEEGGADLMIKEGVLEDPPVKAIFGLHVWPENLGQVLFSPGPIMASSDWFQIVIKGKSSHGAQPHEGIDSIALAAQIIVNLQAIISRTIDPLDSAVLTIGKIEGGTRANIIAQDVKLEGTLRTLNPKTRKTIPELMEKVIKGVTLSFGADYVLNFQKGNPVVSNHPELAKIMLPTLTKVLGKEKVKPLKPQMVAEDFAYYCQKIPGFFFFLGVKNPAEKTMPPLHNPYFNPDERCIPLGIKIMCHLLLDSLEHQSRLDN
jgi:amidohydrolase